jgi:5-methylcytosine-specific restriction endonuclease McrA/rubredoxin
MDDLKQCSKCKEIKPKAEFHKNSMGKDGLESQCRACRAVYDRERAERNKAKNAERPEVPEFKRCPKCGVTKPGDEFSRNSTNADGLKSQCKSCVADYGAEYNATNKLNRAVKDGYRKAVALGNHAELFDGDDLEAHWAENDISSDHCHYCQVHFGALAQAEKQIDHVEALSNGGPHTIENIVPCCKSCNSSKHARELVDWSIG